MSDNNFWFAISARQRMERVVAGALAAKGFDVYLPMSRHERRNAHRPRTEPRPLFPGYLFSRFDPRYRLPILTIPGVFDIIGFNRVPTPVSENEMADMRKVVDSGLEVEVKPLTRGQAVRVTEGPLRNLEGTVLEAGNRYFLTVSITLLQRAVSVQVPKEWLSPIESDAPQSSTQLPALSRVGI